MTCPTGIQTYSSEKEARKAARLNVRWQLFPYRCGICHGWHLKSADHGQRSRRLGRKGR